MAPSEIYAQQLLELNKGYALWDADPHNEPAVEIADVGYIENGAFVRLFNGSKCRVDPINKFGVPNGFQPLPVGAIREGTLSSSLPMKSESVVQILAQVDLSCGPVLQAGACFSFECTREKGAVLVLGDDADRLDALHKQAFIKYILENHTEWLTFANDIHERGICLNDLVLVSGCDKTSAWASAAFSGCSSKIGVKFNVGNVGVAQGGLSVWGSWDNCHSVEAHSGPRIFPHRMLPPTGAHNVVKNQGELPSSDYGTHSRHRKFTVRTDRPDTLWESTKPEKHCPDPQFSVPTVNDGHWNHISAYFMHLCLFLTLAIHRTLQHVLKTVLLQNDTHGLMPPAIMSDPMEAETIQETTIPPGSGRALESWRATAAIDGQVQDTFGDAISICSDPPLEPRPPRNQCVFLRGYKICDRQSMIQRIRRFGRKKKLAHDGFSYITQKKHDKGDPGSSRSNKPSGSSSGSSQYLRNSQATASDNRSAGSGSSCSSPVEEPESPSTTSASSADDPLDFDLLDHDVNMTLDLCLQINEDRDHTPLDAILGYILDNSEAELALAHHDDLVTLLQGIELIDDLGNLISRLSPKIYIENQVGMLESTYLDYLSLDPASESSMKYLPSIPTPCRDSEIVGCYNMSPRHEHHSMGRACDFPALIESNRLVIPDDPESALSEETKKEERVSEALRQRWTCGIKEHGVCLIASDNNHYRLPDDDSAVWVEAICRGEATINQAPHGFLGSDDWTLLLKADANTSPFPDDITGSPTSSASLDTDTELLELPSLSFSPFSLEIDINDTEIDLAEVCQCLRDIDWTGGQEEACKPTSRSWFLCSSTMIATQNSQLDSEGSEIGFTDRLWAQIDVNVFGSGQMLKNNGRGVSPGPPPPYRKSPSNLPNVKNAENVVPSNPLDIDVTEFPWAAGNI